MRALVTLGVILQYLASCAPQVPQSICALDLYAQNNERVLVRAEAVFGRHGAVLRDPQCPNTTLVWREDPAFSESPAAEELSVAIWREEVTQQRRFKVTVEGTIRVVDPETEIVVQRLVTYELAD